MREDEVLLKEDGYPLTIGDVKGKISLWLAERGAADVEGVSLRLVVMLVCRILWVTPKT